MEKEENEKHHHSKDKSTKNKPSNEKRKP